MVNVWRMLCVMESEPGRPVQEPHRSPGEFNGTVVVPTFNHGRALPAVLLALDNQQLPIIVVDDGSTDATEALLRKWSSGCPAKVRKIVVRHEHNMGKAAAICTGLKEAQRRGYTHAVTIDSDGQHDVADLSGLIDQSSRHPNAIVIGARTRGQIGVPGRSRIGRLLSNGLVWIESGIKVSDSQSGMRVYPIAATLALGAKASRFGFETEVLVLAGWRGTPIVEHPILSIYDLPGGRSTHFNLWGDTFAAVRMHARLLIRALGPNVAGHAGWLTGTIPRRLGRWFSPRGLGRMARGDAVSRNRFAASIGVGLFIATLPIYGLKTVVSLWLAAQLKLHPLAVVGVSSLSTPPIGFLFIAYAICAGSLVLTGGLPDLSGLDGATTTQWSMTQELVLEWVVGGVIGGLALGGIAYALIRLMLVRSYKRAA
jgi:uncharacterized protein (DUF2062 family)